MDFANAANFRNMDPSKAQSSVRAVRNKGASCEAMVCKVDAENEDPPPPPHERPTGYNKLRDVVLHDLPIIFVCKKNKKERKKACQDYFFVCVK
jgi:hypothetical protein